MSIQRTTLSAATILFCLNLIQVGVAQGVGPQPESPTHQVLKVTPASLESIRSVHPLVPVMRIAENLRRQMNENVRDYTCVLVKRERIDGELLPFEHVSVKFRGHRPDDGSLDLFSVYAKVLAPRANVGREVLYVEGAHEGDMLVTKGGRRNSTMTFSMRPEGRLARRGNKYPITEFGMENLLARVLEVAQHDLDYDECQVRAIPNTKVDGRSCTMYEVKHPVPRQHFIFHVARIFVDDELQVPVRFAAYTWPEEQGDNPLLVEEYTFRQIKFNVGLIDEDFDHNNPKYGFALSE